MAQKSSLKILDLNFENLRKGLKDYLKSRPDFLDYDFEGSAMSLLIDLLAYNTYQNNYYTSMIGNEMFLDSAQLRASVVSRAKALGYTPRSVVGSRTTLRLVFSNVNTYRFTIPKYSLVFGADIDGVSYNWTNDKSYEVINNDGVFSVDVELVEGDLFDFQWTIDLSQKQKFIIPNDSVDITTLSVEVQNSVSDLTTYRWNRANDIVSIDSETRVYWVQEVEDEQFELIFGDDVVGRGLENGNILTVTFRIANGSETNGVSFFTGPSSIEGFFYTATVLTPSDGGADIQTIDQIKFVAPKNYEVQNRAVVSTDYERLIRQNFSYIGSLRVWGGETNEPPLYGKVFISVKPTIGFTLGQLQKDNIKNFLKQYNALTTDIVFIDPTFLYVSPQIKVIWDSTKTTLTENEIREGIISAVEDFAANNLDTFDRSILYHSRFTDVVDESDVAVLSNQTNFLLEKRFTPNFNNRTRYILNFRNKLRLTNPNNTPVITSTKFSIEGKENCYLEDDKQGNIIIYTYENFERVYFKDTYGTIDYEKGLIELYPFGPQSAENEEIRITAIPYDLNVESDKYQIMTLTDYTITMIDNSENYRTTAQTVTTLNSVTYVREQLTGIVV